MTHEEKKRLLRKLIKDEMSSEEFLCLLVNKSISKYMFRQWETYIPEDETDTKLRIFNKIKKQAWGNQPIWKLHYYKLSLVASVLMIIGLSFTVFFSSQSQYSFNTFIATSGIQNMQSILLPDGTNVQLGAGSKLTYPEKFIGNSRVVYLDGQAFFDVVKNKEKPFIIHSSCMDIMVLGTSFEVFDYKIENKSEIILLKGSIEAKIADKNSNNYKYIKIKQNERIIINKQSKIITKEFVNANKYTSWRNRGILTFENEKLSMIIPRLEQWFGRKIICQKDIAEKYRFTFKVRDESMERILFIMGKSSPIKYDKMEGGDYILKED